MTAKPDIFARAGDGTFEPTPDGNERRIVCWTPELMMVEFRFEAGGVGWLHEHPHVQSSYVAEGAFEVTVDGRTETLRAGDCFIVPSGLRHGVKALEKGRLVDTFTPFRQDFLSHPPG
ncbi:cupin domain-containing protein [Aureimonas phyllosphaerae]|uniref:cupin domain-containing protein n=1 Tax=Aureimonas phyllosphaerae TaxID=1166078 RepID=UPI003A5BA8D3